MSVHVCHCSRIGVRITSYSFPWPQENDVFIVHTFVGKKHSASTWMRQHPMWARLVISVVPVIQIRVLFVANTPGAQPCRLIRSAISVQLQQSFHFHPSQGVCSINRLSINTIVCHVFRRFFCEFFQVHKLRQHLHDSITCTFSDKLRQHDHKRQACLPVSHSHNRDAVSNNRFFSVAVFSCTQDANKIKGGMTTSIIGFGITLYACLFVN